MIIALCAIAQASAFVPSSSLPFVRTSIRPVQATPEELYEAATVCSKGGCSLEAVTDLKSKLDVRKDELMVELAKVQSLSGALGDLSGKDESQLKMVVDAIVKLFSKSDEDMMTTGVATGFSMDPTEGVKDAWDYDMAWKNYYAKLKEEDS